MTITKDTYIRNLNTDLYRRMRLLSIEQGVAVGEVINAAMAEYLARFDARLHQVASEAEQDT